MADVLGDWTGQQIDLPDGGFYLWFSVGDAWALAERLAAKAGLSSALVSSTDPWPATTCESPWYNLTIGSSSSRSG